MRRFFFILCLLITAFLAFLDNGTLKYKWQSLLEPLAQQDIPDFEKYHAKNFIVTKVVDGDTLDINYPDGRNSYTKIRLIGVDTPEIFSESGAMYFGPEASEFTKKSALDKRVTIYLDEGNDTRDKYGRLLAYVGLPDDIILNELLLSEGYAYAYTKFRHSFSNKYKQLESRARSGKKGLWKNVTSEQMPDWRQ